MIKRLILLTALFWGALGLVCLIATYARAESPIRLNVSLTCKDIVALVAWAGWDEIERRAREAGASQASIDRAKSCLK